MDLYQLKNEIKQAVERTDDRNKLEQIAAMLGVNLSSNGSLNGSSSQGSGDSGNMSREEFLKRLRGG